MPFVLKQFRPLLRAVHSDRGTAAVSFILCFPIFLSIVAIVVQFALIANANVVVQHAANAAARSAATSLPDGHPENVRKAACMALAPISPEAMTSADPEAVEICTAMRDHGTGVSWSYANRYTYAMDATHVDIDAAGHDYEHTSSQDLEVTVRYRFKLTVPVANAFLAHSTNSVGGVSGRFYEIVHTGHVSMSPSRRVPAQRDGWPLQ